MGEVVWLGRYPVKSMLGEEPDGIDVERDGVRGDRRWALVDEETGLVASAKNPRRWRALLAIRAGYRDGRLEITLPDGRRLYEGRTAADCEVDAALSRALGRRVRLTDRRPEGATLERLTPEGEPGAGTLTAGRLGAGVTGASFVDFGAVHVVATATLDALGAAHPRGVVDARRLRPNVVVRMLDRDPFAENGWPGRRLTIGDGAVLRVVVPTPRCVVPTLAQGPGAQGPGAQGPGAHRPGGQGPGGADVLADLAEDPQVLRAAARLNRVPVLDLGMLTCLGAYADVEAPGRIRVGDPVRVS